MTKLAVISDVHANLPALEAVLEQIDKYDCDQLLCLGDLVGYNAEPAPCIDLLRMRANIVVAGNHDRDVLKEASAGTRSSARYVQKWTHGALTQTERDYLRDLPSHVVTNEFACAHGAFLSEVYVSGYVTSTMLEHNLQAIEARTSWPGLAFCGHTHVPMLGVWDGVETSEHNLRKAATWSHHAHVVLVNPGSVGQPRDGDPRAAFAIVDTEARRVEVPRVRYDVERAVRAMQEAGFPDELWERLREGR